MGEGWGGQGVEVERGNNAMREGVGKNEKMREKLAEVRSMV